MSEGEKERLFDRMLEVIEHDIIPLTRSGVAVGNKVFGAAILRKDDLSLVVAGSNSETESPLWHGEVYTIKKFYELEERPDPQECIFLSTHDPCSMCISAICWGGFNELYYFFDFNDTKDSFNIPHDLNMLHEVFCCEAPTRQNAFYKAIKLTDWVNELTDPNNARQRIAAIGEQYQQLSAVYQKSKGENEIPLK